MGSLKSEFGGSEKDILLPDDAKVSDLISALNTTGIEISTSRYVVALNGKGLQQCPKELGLSESDELILIPPLMGG
jgi:molybdopterin converting factor small subunit